MAMDKTIIGDNG